mgnify:FL=1|jgi:hypothetical protein
MTVFRPSLPDPRRLDKTLRLHLPAGSVSKSSLRRFRSISVACSQVLQELPAICLLELVSESGHDRPTSLTMGPCAFPLTAAAIGSENDCDRSWDLMSCGRFAKKDPALRRCAPLCPFDLPMPNKGSVSSLLPSVKHLLDTSCALLTREPRVSGDRVGN